MELVFLPRARTNTPSMTRGKIREQSVKYSLYLSAYAHLKPHASPRYENPRHRFNVLWHGHVHQTSGKVLTLQCRGACCTASGSSLACCPDRNSCRLPRFRPGRSSCTPPLRSWNLTENGNRISICDWRMITCRRNVFRKYRDLICFVIVLFAVILGNKTGVIMLNSNCKAENYRELYVGSRKYFNTDNFYVLWNMCNFEML